MHSVYLIDVVKLNKFKAYSLRQITDRLKLIEYLSVSMKI